MSLRNNNQRDNSLLYGDFAYNVAKKRENSNLHEGLDSRFHSHYLHVSLLSLPLICPLLNLSVRYSLEFLQILLKRLHVDRTLKVKVQDHITCLMVSKRNRWRGYSFCMQQ